MISIRKEKLIRKLLGAGFSKPEVSRLSKVSVSTIKVIGRLKCLRLRKRKRAMRMELQKLKEPARCRECGGLIFLLPCVLCRPIAWR